MRLVLFQTCTPLAFLFYIPIEFLNRRILGYNTAPHLERMLNSLHFRHGTKKGLSGRLGIRPVQGTLAVPDNYLKLWNRR